MAGVRPFIRNLNNFTTIRFLFELLNLTLSNVMFIKMTYELNTKVLNKQ